MDMKRSAALQSIAFRGVPSNSRARPDAQPPYLNGLLANRTLAAVRMIHVRSCIFTAINSA